MEDKLCDTLKDLNKLQEFLNEHKDNRNLKRVLNLRDDEGNLIALQYARDYHDEASYEKAKNLLLEAGKNDCKELDRKKRLPGVLWNLNQQERLRTFLKKVNGAQSMNELEQVVSKVIKSGVRLNLPNQGSLYGKAYKSKYCFADYVIKKISELKKKHKTEKDIEVASGIVCKLVLEGAVLYNINNMCIIDELEEFESHKANMKEAFMDRESRTLKFMEVVKGAASGKVQDARMDNSTFYLEYSEDSTIHVAKITDEARNLGLTQAEEGYGRDIIKIGKSEVEI